MVCLNCKPNNRLICVSFNVLKNNRSNYRLCQLWPDLSGATGEGGGGDGAVKLQQGGQAGARKHWAGMP